MSNEIGMSGHGVAISDGFAGDLNEDISKGNKGNRRRSARVARRSAQTAWSDPLNTSFASSLPSPPQTLSASFDDALPAAKRRKTESNPKHHGKSVDKNEEIETSEQKSSLAACISPVSAFSSTRPRNPDGTFVRLKGTGSAALDSSSPQAQRPKSSKGKKSAHPRHTSSENVMSLAAAQTSVEKLSGRRKSDSTWSTLQNEDLNIATRSYSLSEKIPSSRKPGAAADIGTSSRRDKEEDEIGTSHSVAQLSWHYSEWMSKIMAEPSAHTPGAGKTPIQSASSMFITESSANPLGSADSASLVEIIGRPTTRRAYKASIHPKHKSPNRMVTTTNSDTKHSLHGDSVSESYRFSSSSLLPHDFYKSSLPNPINALSKRTVDSNSQFNTYTSPISTIPTTGILRTASDMSLHYLDTSLSSEETLKPTLWQLFSSRCRRRSLGQEPADFSAPSFDKAPSMTFGLDGEVDIPDSSPESLGTAVPRTSGRLRKPTIRAIESMQSQQAETGKRKVAPQKLQPVNDDAIDGSGIGTDHPALAASSVSAQSSSTSAKSTEVTDVSILEPDLELADCENSGIHSILALGKRFYEFATSIIVNAAEAELHADAKVLTELRITFQSREPVRTETKGTVSGAAVGGGAIQCMPGSDKPFFLNFPVTGTPWTDQDGWLYTGRANEHGEEIILVPEDRFQLYRPTNTNIDMKLPAPPVRIRSHEQAQKDKTFGYPPRFGNPNTPQDLRYPSQFENVNDEIGAAQLPVSAVWHGLEVDSAISLHEPRQSDLILGMDSVSHDVAPLANTKTITPTPISGSNVTRTTDSTNESSPNDADGLNPSDSSTSKSVTQVADDIGVTNALEPESARKPVSEPDSNKSKKASKKASSDKKSRGAASIGTRKSPRTIPTLNTDAVKTAAADTNKAGKSKSSKEKKAAIADSPEAQNSREILVPKKREDAFLTPTAKAESSDAATGPKTGPSRKRSRVFLVESDTKELTDSGLDKTLTSLRPADIVPKSHKHRRAATDADRAEESTIAIPKQTGPLNNTTAGSTEQVVATAKSVENPTKIMENQQGSLPSPSETSEKSHRVPVDEINIKESEESAIDLAEQPQNLHNRPVGAGILIIDGQETHSGSASVKKVRFADQPDADKSSNGRRKCRRDEPETPTESGGYDDERASKKARTDEPEGGDEDRKKLVFKSKTSEPKHGVRTRKKGMGR